MAAEDDPDGALEAEEHAALKWAAVIAVLVILWLVRPVAVGILLGTFLAFMAQPAFEGLKRRIGMRWSAILTVLVSTLALAGTLGGLAWLFVAQGTALANRLIDSFGPGGVGQDALEYLSRLTAKFGLSQEDLAARARGLAGEAATRAAELAASIASTTGSALLALLFAMLAMHYILRNWQTVSQRAQEAFPLRPDYTAALFAEFRQVGRTTLLGAFGTAIAQGVFATIGYWMTGVPEPLFFGAATAVASFVPAVGVLLVIVPVAIGLSLVGHIGAGLVELIWGLVFVVSVSDYVIRPRLVRGERQVPSLVTFAALFGGIEVLGLKGLIIGPVVMAIAVAVLRLYAKEMRTRRHLPEPHEPAPPITKPIADG
ncbi:MAG: putative Membrane protein [Myxococcales bacterium]|nr:putative Membrane protein [Myxococcales bacterium]